MFKYKTSDQQARYNASVFLEICYACFYGILAVPLTLIGIIFLALQTPPFGSYLAMLIVGILFLILCVLSSLNAVWLRHYANADPKKQKVMKIMQIVTLNIYGYVLLNPEKPKKKKKDKVDQVDVKKTTGEPKTKNA